MAFILCWEWGEGGGAGCRRKITHKSPRETLARCAQNVLPRGELCFSLEQGVFDFMVSGLKR